MNKRNPFTNLFFENKVALVTGAGSGIGLATAKAFAEAGASVVLADNHASKHGVLGMTKSGALEYASRGRFELQRAN